MMRALSSLALIAVVAGCQKPGGAEVLVGLVPPGQQGALRGVEARLTLTDKDGEHPRLQLLGVPGADGVDVVGEDVPLGCDDFGCGGNVSVDAGDYDAVLTLSALDRCDSRADVLRYTGPVAVGHWDSQVVDLDLDDAAFDDDDDGVFNVFEASACGRFDFSEGVSPPRHCGDGGVDCCDGVSDVEGAMVVISGGETTLPYDTDAGLVAVDEFSLDATEVTYGMLERCVLAGTCLQNRPENVARARLDTPIDRRLPVTGLLPVDAAAVCAAFGKRLPHDREWDFAAADRDGVRAKYPIDVDDGAVISCRETGLPPAAAHQQFGADCPSAPLPVGSYPSSTQRGLADLAGNVAEWTLSRGTGADVDDADNDGVPDGAVAVVLRGGGVASFVELLENDLPLVFNVDDAGDRAALAAAAPDVGFRCAVDGALASVPEATEQECPNGDAVAGDEPGDVSPVP